MNKQTYHIRLKVDKEKDLTIVNIKGDAGIRNISALKGKLTKIEYTTNQVDIRFQKPEIIKEPNRPMIEQCQLLH